MSMNGKRDAFTRDDFRTCAKSALLRRGLADGILEEVRAAVARWAEFAEGAGVSPMQKDQIGMVLRIGSME